MKRLSGTAAAFFAVVLLVGCSGKTEPGVESEGGGAAVRPSNPPSAPESNKHLLMVVELEPDAHVARTLSAQSVDLPLPKRRRAEPGPWQVQVISADGRTLHEGALPDAGLLRGEFKNADGSMESVTRRKASTAVTLRLPLLHEAATIRVLATDAANPATMLEIARFAYPKVSP
jgi:hypothetical protein